MSNDLQNDTVYGKGLPLRVLQGIAGTYHGRVSKRKLNTLAGRQKIRREVGESDESLVARYRLKIRKCLASDFLSGMNGLEATRRIRELEAGSGDHVPIVALTASLMKNERELCLFAGMDAVVGKPVDFDELFEVMEKLVPEGWE